MILEALVVIAGLYAAGTLICTVVWALIDPDTSVEPTIWLSSTEPTVAEEGDEWYNPDTRKHQLLDRGRWIPAPVKEHA